MSWSPYLLAAFFLPLFPLSMLFNQGFARLRQPELRVLILLIWPQIGIGFISQAETSLPNWMSIWALLSAIFYAYRAIALREVGLWIGFVATSAWSLLWFTGVEPDRLSILALGFSLPLVLLALLTGFLEKRLGGAHLALTGGLAITAPRFAALFVVAILAAIATPIFPSFFNMLTAILQQTESSPTSALGLTVVWLLWSWSGIRLLQGIVVGSPKRTEMSDMSRLSAWLYSAAFVALAFIGIEMGGTLL